jgi:hypothetical protein
MTKDLVVLVADKNMQFGIEGLLSRHQALNIRLLTPDNYDIYVHPRHDPGVYQEAADFLRQYLREYSYALVFLDHEGSGQEQSSPDATTNALRENIEQNGWRNRVEVLVFRPEFEIWLWTDSPHVSNALGWDSFSALRQWLAQENLWAQDEPKPQRPKEALEQALKHQRIARSSSIYREIAEQVSPRRCQDSLFQKFKAILQNWFPPGRSQTPSARLSSD